MKKIFIKLAALFSLILLIPFSSHALEMKAGVAKAVITPKSMSTAAEDIQSA